MMLQRFFLGLTLFSMGLSLPTAAYAEETSNAEEVGNAIENAVETSEEPQSQTPVESRFNIEERLVSAGDEPIEYEQTFTGYANETIVVYWEANRGPAYAATPLLYGSDGEQVGSSHYPSEISVAEFDGRHVMFQLPTTDEYRLVFLVDGVTLADDGTDGGLDYLVSARVASFYERSMMYAIEMLDDERYDEALTGFTLATEQRPTEPMAYVGHLLALSIPAAEAAGLSEDEMVTAAGMTQLYQSLEPDMQAMVLSDLRQISKGFEVAIENGAIAAEDIDLETVLFEDIAVYLETGVPSSALLEVLGELE